MGVGTESDPQQRDLRGRKMQRGENSRSLGMWGSPEGGRASPTSEVSASIKKTLSPVWTREVLVWTEVFLSSFHTESLECAQ